MTRKCSAPMNVDPCSKRAHLCSMATVTRKTVLLRARVPANRMRKAEKIFAQMGLKPGEAINAFLAQVELRNAMPFAITADPEVEEFMGNPEFRQFLADEKAGKIRYTDASKIAP